MVVVIVGHALGYYANTEFRGAFEPVTGGDRPFTREEQQFEILRHVAHLVGRQQRPAVGCAGLVGMDSTRDRQGDDGFFSTKIGEQGGRSRGH